MKRFLQIIFFTIMFTGLLNIRYSFAHHGWSYYKDDFRLTLIVTELKLRNPHDQIIGRKRFINLYTIKIHKNNH